MKTVNGKITENNKACMGNDIQMDLHTNETVLKLLIIKGKIVKDKNFIF